MNTHVVYNDTKGQFDLENEGSTSSNVFKGRMSTRDLLRTFSIDNLGDFTIRDSNIFFKLAVDARVVYNLVMHDYTENYLEKGMFERKKGQEISLNVKTTYDFNSVKDVTIKMVFNDTWYTIEIIEIEGIINYKITKE